VKWIPVEVITVYKAAMGAIPENWINLRVWSSAASLVITALWIAFATTPAPGRVAWRQVLLAPVAFACWAVATQPDIVRRLYPAWEPWMAILVLCGGTLLLPILEGVLKALGVPQN